MQNFYINSVKIDWSQISKDSYLRKIKAIKKLEKFSFEKPVTIFSGKMALENQLFLKLLQRIMVLMKKAEP